MNAKNSRNGQGQGHFGGKGLYNTCSDRDCDCDHNTCHDQLCSVCYPMRREVLVTVVATQ